MPSVAKKCLRQKTALYVRPVELLSKDLDVAKRFYIRAYFIFFAHICKMQTFLKENLKFCITVARCVFFCSKFLKFLRQNKYYLYSGF